MRKRVAILFAALAAATALPAQAQFYSPGGPFLQPGLPPPPAYGRPYEPYRQPHAAPGYGPISCGEGAQIIASQGFRNISVRECSGRVYRYTAYRRGAPFEVRISSRTGDITMIRAIGG